MLHLREIVPRTEVTKTPAATATLTLADRRRSRLRIMLDGGQEAAVRYRFTVEHPAQVTVTGL
jgi:urease accessory protein UreE